MTRNPIPFSWSGRPESVGRHVVTEAVRQGYATRALVRDARELVDAVGGVDAVVFTQGAPYGNAPAAQAVDYGAVKYLLVALDGRRVTCSVWS